VNLTIGEIIQILTTVVIGATVIITNKNDLKWIKLFFDHHEAEDSRRFDELKDDISRVRNFTEG
jgi:hypothetical protein